jgi:hypothetical protein
VGTKVVGHEGGAGIPPRQHPRRSNPGVGVQVVHRMRCSTWTPTPGPLRGKLADVTGYPLPLRPSCVRPTPDYIHRYINDHGRWERPWIRIVGRRLPAWPGRSVRESWVRCGLIFGLIRLRSPKFICVRINAEMQVADVSGIRRTVIPTSENRKIGSFIRRLRDLDFNRNSPDAVWFA